MLITLIEVLVAVAIVEMNVCMPLQLQAPYSSLQIMNAPYSYDNYT